jgi:NAD-dependent deacetylase sirtuin 5
VVWFGERLPEDALARAAAVVHATDLLLVIGTSGVVYPAAGFVTMHSGLSIEINPEASAVSSACTLAVAERAAAAVPPLVDAILEGVS